MYHSNFNPRFYTVIPTFWLSLLNLELCALRKWEIRDMDATPIRTTKDLCPKCPRLSCLTPLSLAHSSLPPKLIISSSALASHCFSCACSFFITSWSICCYAIPRRLRSSRQVSFLILKFSPAIFFLQVWWALAAFPLVLDYDFYNSSVLAAPRSCNNCTSWNQIKWFFGFFDPMSLIFYNKIK